MTASTTGGSIAPLRNVIAFDALLQRLTKRRESLPGLGVFYGDSGQGKTYAASFAAQEYRAYYVQMGSAWTKRYFCKAVMVQMGLARRGEEPKGSIPDLIARIGEQLVLSGRPLLIDDAQFLVMRGMAELVRDMYESSQAAICLIGEESLPDDLRRLERVHNRVLDWVEAQPCDVSDCAQLAKIYCPAVQVEQNLLEKLCEATGGCTRRICTNLDHVREFAQGHSLTAINAQAYSGRIDTGTPEGR